MISLTQKRAGNFKESRTFLNIWSAGTDDANCCGLRHVRAFSAKMDILFMDWGARVERWRRSGRHEAASVSGAAHAASVSPSFTAKLQCSHWAFRAFSAQQRLCGHVPVMKTWNTWNGFCDWTSQPSDLALCYIPYLFQFTHCTT